MKKQNIVCYVVYSMLFLLLTHTTFSGIDNIPTSNFSGILGKSSNTFGASSQVDTSSNTQDASAMQRLTAIDTRTWCYIGGGTTITTALAVACYMARKKLREKALNYWYNPQYAVSEDWQAFCNWLSDFFPQET